MLTAPIKAAIVALHGFIYEPCVVVSSPECGMYEKYNANYWKLNNGNLVIIDQMGRRIELTRGDWWIE